MRLRNVKGSRETIAASQFTIDTLEIYKGKWSEVFGNENPIYIEVGMGKGKFITTLAAMNPTINYIGIEKYLTDVFSVHSNKEQIIYIQLSSFLNGTN